jgi:hypothetical protein
MYKLLKNPITGETNQVLLDLNDGNQIVFGIDNPDSSNYANFKADILADKAELQDADGNTMTSEQAKAYIEELP